MIFFLFDPHILLFDPHILLFVVFLFVVFYLIHIYFYLWYFLRFAYLIPHVYMYLKISKLSLMQTRVLMCLCLCQITLPDVQIKMVAIASLLPTVRSFILLLEFLHLKIFPHYNLHAICFQTVSLLEILINIHYLFTHPSTILKYTILKYKNCSIYLCLDHAKCLE